MADYIDLFIDQGSDWNDTLTLTDDTTNTAINVVGYTAQSQLKRSFYSSNISANLICTVTDGPNGIISLSMSAANSLNILPQRYLFDVITTSPSGNVTRVLEGTITVNAGVTR